MVVTQDGLDKDTAINDTPKLLSCSRMPVAIYTQVRFRLLVFRPFVGEILSGKVSSCTKDGIKVSLDFFENASVPKDLLQSPSTL